MMKAAQILLAAALAAFVMPAQAEKIPLDRISDYLNRLTVAESDFIQINPDGSGAKGRVIISRPGRMRFEYAPPDRTLVLASAGHLAIFDAKSNQPPEQYPLSKTPLKLILGRDIDLTRESMVVDHREEGEYTLITAMDPAHPEYGSIELGFSDAPLMLRQWVVTDEAGGQTTILLDALRTGRTYPSSTFQIEAEMRARGLD